MSSEAIAQLTGFTGCSEAVARELLSKYDGSIERAANSFFEDQEVYIGEEFQCQRCCGDLLLNLVLTLHAASSYQRYTNQSTSNEVAPWPGSFPDPHVEWSKPIEPPSGSATPVVPAMHQQPESVFRPWNEPPAYDAAAGIGGASGNVTKSIDLTGDMVDPDEDLQKAMAASLQDSRETHYPPQQPASSQAMIGPLPDSQATGREASATGRTRKRRSPSGQVSEEGPSVGPPKADAWAPTDAPPQQRYGLRDRGKIVKPNLGVAAMASLQLSPTARSSTARGRGRGGRHQGSRAYGRRRPARTKSAWLEEDGLEPTLSEDEQLRQALEASVQSHNGAGLDASGIGTPLLPSHLELGEHSQRKEGAPVALAPPFATIDIVAAMLQAMYAATPARHALLSFIPGDERASDLVNFWKGVSPSSEAGTPLFSSVDARIRPSVDMCRRIQTLFTFMNESERSACVITDVSALTPNRIIMMGANRVPPGQIAATYYEFVASAFEEALQVSATLATSSAEQLPPGADVEQFKLQMTRERASIFNSYGAVAYASPPSPSAGQFADGVPHPSSIPVARNQLGLLHDSINADVFSCLRAALASDGEGALITEGAEVLCMTVEHQNSAEPLPPFVVEETLYLDPFLWNRRQGIRLDSELYEAELLSTNAAIHELEVRKKKLDASGGQDVAALLRATIDYFQRLAVVGQDSMRKQMQDEAAPRLKQILSRLEQERQGTDALIASLKAQVDSKRLQLRRSAQDEAAKPEWRTIAYELQSVLVHESHRIIAYVKQHDARWWRVCEGLASEVKVDEVTGDKVRGPDSAGVFWVCYQRRRQGPAPDEPGPEATKSAVYEDNLTLQSELLSLARSDAATPVAEGAGSDAASAAGLDTAIEAAATATSAASGAASGGAAGITAA
ncbi:hypothetical protein ACQY0O_001321 [Thecaphora frezii]